MKQGSGKVSARKDRTSRVAWYRRPLVWNAWSLGAVFLVFLVEPALAQETMPWEGPLETVMNSLCGPVAQAAAVIAFVVTGLLVAFGELNGLFGVMMRVAFGLSIALFAVNFLDFFGVAGFACGA